MVELAGESGVKAALRGECVGMRSPILAGDLHGDKLVNQSELAAV